MVFKTNKASRICDFFCFSKNKAHLVTKIPYAFLCPRRSTCGDYKCTFGCLSVCFQQNFSLSVIKFLLNYWHCIYIFLFVVDKVFKSDAYFYTFSRLSFVLDQRTYVRVFVCALTFIFWRSCTYVELKCKHL